LKSNFYLEKWNNYNGENVKIVIIDSGINLNHPKIKHLNIKGFSINGSNNDYYVIANHINDNIGHGTAITFIINKLLPSSEIIMVKVFDELLNVKNEKLLYALEYIHKNIDCDIVHMSLGMRVCDDIGSLKSICDMLSEKGTIIVSAFDNEGAVSYPADFPSVIGVDQSLNCSKDYDIEYIQAGKGINVLAKGVGQKLPWVDPPYVLQAGSSYSAAYVTGFVGKIISAGNSKEDIMNLLKQNAKKKYSVNVKNNSNFFNISTINKAICFPFNKEIHSMIRFDEMLQFELVGVYDTKYGGKLNRSVSTFIGSDVSKEYLLQDIKQVDWNGYFDTVIIGHTNIINEKTNEDYLDFILDKCIAHNKNVYCLDDLTPYMSKVNKLKEKRLFAQYPKVSIENFTEYPLGKLRVIGKPVVGIFGTSSKQGKFTLQLKLRKKFLEDGYVVGQLGTEPSSLLFGFNEVYPMGYNSTVTVSGFDAVQVLNVMMGSIEDKNPDIIIVGSQSGTVPYSTFNLTYYTTPQIEFLLGTQPDAIILCINSNDDIQYIKRTLYTLEGLVSSKVIGIVIYPFEKEVSVLHGVKMKMISKEMQDEFKRDISSKLQINTYFLNDEVDIQNLYTSIINFF